MRTSLVSAVPDHSIGRACIGYLRRFGVETENIIRRPGRLGVIFVDPGGAGRSTQVIYDRAASVFATCDPDAYDWPAALAGFGWLHVSGTVAATGEAAATALQRGLHAARELGLTVSLDLNYRSALWSEAAAGAALRPVMPYVDVLLGSGPDAATILGVTPQEQWSTATDSAVQEHAAVAESLRRAFGLRQVGGTVRTVDDGIPQLSGLVADASGIHVSQRYPVTEAVGRIGTGDAFAAGLIRGLMLAQQMQTAVEFAAAAAHLKQSVVGDVNVVTLEEVERVVARGPVDQVLR